MSVKKYKLPILVQFVVVISLYGQQTPQISHHMFNTPMHNPASVGFTNSIIATGVHRQQWYGMEGAPQTTFVSLDAPLRVINSGIGLNLVSDQIGQSNNTIMQLAYNYQISFLSGTLGMGIHLGMNSMGLITPKWDPREPNDRVLQNLPQDASSFLFDIGAGLFYQVPNQYEIGISLGHINQPRSSDMSYEQRRCLNLSANYNFSWSMFPKIDFVPSALIKSDLTSTQVDVSLTGVYNRQFWGGFTIRPGDAIALFTGLHLQETFQIPLQVGVSYDLATNWMFRSSKIGGSFELFVRYAFNLSVDRIPQSYKNSRFL